MSIKNVISYFRECYLNDNKSVSVANIFSADIEKLRFISDKEEIITDYLPYYPVSEEYAQEVQKVLSVHSKEKELCYFSFLLLGTDTINDKSRKIIAPLYIYSSEIFKKDDLNYISVDLENRQFNSEILRPFFDQENNKVEFNDIIAEHFSSIDDYSKLSFLFDKYFKNIDSTYLIDFPKLKSISEVKKLMMPAQVKKRSDFIIVPASGMAILKKKGEARGILTELEEMAETNIYSDSLRTLFSNKISKINRVSKGRVPNILSNSQKNALNAASQYPLSLIVGPPGTGKSYTIASMAIEHLSRNKSVLIVSRTDKAVDVVADKIEYELGLKEVVVRAGRSQYLRELKSNLQDILNGAKVYSQSDVKLNNQKKTKIHEIEEKIAYLENQFFLSSKFERKWGMFLSGNDKSGKYFGRLKRKYVHWQSERVAPAWENISELESNLELLERTIKEYIKESFEIQKYKTVSNNRGQLKLLLQSLKARTGVRKENLLNQIDFDVLLGTFPIWLVNMKDIHKILPMNNELFDLAIIDEATQCDIATSLPIFQRAKHVVVTGDPKQLKHISFLSRSMQQKLVDKYIDISKMEISPDSFDYRKQSILDSVSNSTVEQKQVSYLNEHFRSTPAIIRFSNQEIYKNSLRIMTEKPDIPYNMGLELIWCKGTRDSAGINHDEAERVIEAVQEVYLNEKSLNSEICQTIGILSPFRGQVDYLKKLCESELSIDVFDRHRILIGTAYEFQGEERDIMMLSFSLDTSSHSMAFYHLNKPDVFNVSITRARSIQKIFCSFDPTKLPQENLARKYISQIQFDIESKEQQKVDKDEFQEEVTKELEERDIKVWKAYQIAGLKVDMVVKNKNTNFGIDLIGYPGEFEDAFTLERYKILRRAKLPVFPLPYSAWIFRKEDCIDAIMEFVSVKD